MTTAHLPTAAEIRSRYGTPSSALTEADLIDGANAVLAAKTEHRAALHQLTELQQPTDQDVRAADAHADHIDALDALDYESLARGAVNARQQAAATRAAGAAKTRADAGLGTTPESLRGSTMPAYDGVARVATEEHTYNPRSAQDGISFFRDGYAAQFTSDYQARQRLERSQREAEVDGRTESRGESRAVTTAGFAGLVVPQYLTDLAALLARVGRPVANTCTRLQIPDQGMSFLIPRGTTGTSAASQATENTSLSATDEVWANLTLNVATVGGQADISRQSLERGTPGIDQLVYGDICGAYAAEVDRQVINGSGSSGQVLGIYNTAGINQATAFTAAATVTTFMSKLSGAINSIESAGTVVAPANLIVMHPRRWSWLTLQVDTQGRPLVSPAANGLQVVNGFGVDAAPGAYSGKHNGTTVDFTGVTIKGYLAGLPVVTDANMPAAVGTGPEDLVFVLNTAHMILFEDGDGMPHQLRFEQTLANQLTTKIVGYGYVAFTAGRYPAAASVIGGNAGTIGFGLVSPVF